MDMIKKTAPLTAADLPQAKSTPPENARLIVLRGPQAGEKIFLQSGMNLFGREEGIIIKDGRVSRRHAQILASQTGFILADLDSTNGTFVNGTQITQPTLLQHGDTIRLGDTILTIRLDEDSQDDPTAVGARPPETRLGRGESTLMGGRLAPKTSNPPPANAPEAPPEAPDEGSDHPST